LFFYNIIRFDLGNPISNLVLGRRTVLQKILKLNGDFNFLDDIPSILVILSNSSLAVFLDAVTGESEH
jgi:hypothetical protein